MGVALAGAPGPVQAIIVSEAVRAGTNRAIRACAGASIAFGTLLLAAAFGFSTAIANPLVLRLMRFGAAALLIWLAIEGLRTQRAVARTDAASVMRPELRGSLAVWLNPGAWLFVATAASSVIAAARLAAGTRGALVAVISLMAGAASGDVVLALFGGLYLSRRERLARLIQRLLAITLGLLGIYILAKAAIG